jgi:hypothetical protein
MPLRWQSLLLIPFAKLDEAFSSGGICWFFSQSVDSEPEAFMLRREIPLLEMIPYISEAEMPFALFFGNQVMAFFDLRTVRLDHEMKFCLTDELLMGRDQEAGISGAGDQMVFHQWTGFQVYYPNLGHCLPPFAPIAFTCGRKRHFETQGLPVIACHASSRGQ